MSEFEEKLERIWGLLAKHHLDALLLERVSSFAWATCGGASYINTASSEGAASLLITPSARYIITNNIEARRLEQEQGLAAQGWEWRVMAWSEPEDVVGQLAGSMRLGADSCRLGAVDVSEELARLRANLTPDEDARFAALGRISARAMEQAVRRVQPGQTEHEIAALLAEETESRGAQAIVVLVATDERISLYRHPLPTDRKLKRYAMLVLCARKWGLVCSMTRLVHFGNLPEELRRKQEACAFVDATLISATRPGAAVAEVFKLGMAAYAAQGFPDEWQSHHQGGPAGYEPREFVATPHSTGVVAAGQVYAWNPSITGVKSEDSILVGAKENEVPTSIEGWPTLTVSLPDGQMVERPAILENP